MMKRILIFCLLLLSPIFIFSENRATYKVGESKVSIEPENTVFSLALAGYGFPGEGRFSVAWSEIEALPAGATEEDKAVWTNAVRTDDFLSIVRYKERLYALGKDLVLYKGDINPGKIEWIKAGYNNGETYTVDLKRLAVAGNQLYAVGSDNKYYIAKHNTQGDLSVRAVAINSGKKTVALVGVDLCGFDYSFIEEVKKEITQKTKIPGDAILINASHTHFAPVPQNYPSWPGFGQRPDPVYLYQVVKPGIIKSVEMALKNMKKSTIQTGRSESIIGGNRALSGPDGLYDPTLDVVRFESLDKKKITILFTAACHPVFRNEGKERYTISANFPGVARDIVENKGKVDNAIFFQGCAGDINPLDGDYHHTGTVLGNDVVEMLEIPMNFVSGEISYALDSVLVSVSPWSKEKIEEFRVQNRNKEGDLEAEKNVRWADRMLTLYQTGSVPEVMPVYIQTINIGNWKLVGLSREAVTEYSLKIRELWPDKFVSVASYCNDVASYLPNAAHVRAQNYEGFNSFLWYGQAAIFPENILDIVIDSIKKQNK